MKISKDDDRRAFQFVAQQIHMHSKFANFPWFELAQSRSAARIFDQASRRLFQEMPDFASKQRVVGVKEVSEPINIVARLN